ncbi:DUF2922 domain-containing protein [Enterococcus sp. AZ163]|uniref:DUF2922 domain-containing protein n=1 Tax=Enterococcus sp. AZ163 TaxID=2774638 RepID=UPI003D2E000A
MIRNMLSLSATFENSAGRRHSFNLKEPNRNKSAKEIRASLEKLVSLNLFEKGEVGLFKKLVSAKFVETIETPIFDLRKSGMSTPEMDTQPENLHVGKVQEVRQSTSISEVQPGSVQIPKALAPEVTSASIQPIAAPSASNQRGQLAAAQGELQQLEIIIPEDVDVNSLTEEDYIAMITAQLPKGATLESFSVEEVAVDTEESAEHLETTAEMADTESVRAGTAKETPKEFAKGILEEPLPKKESGWFPKRKKGSNPLAGFSANKRKNKKAIKDLKRNKKK